MPLNNLKYCAILVTGCAEKIGEERPSSVEWDLVISTIENDDGSWSTTVNASDDSSWVYWTFGAQLPLEVESPELDLTWTLGFQRYKIKLNGGVSGSANTHVALLQDHDFSENADYDVIDFMTDEADQDEDGVPEYAMKDWFIYDTETHLLSPADLVYMVKLENNDHYYIQLDDYYDDAGSSGFPQFTWRAH